MAIILGVVPLKKGESVIGYHFDIITSDNRYRVIYPSTFPVRTPYKNTNIVISMKRGKEPTTIERRG